MKKAFTLVELLVTISIITILTAIVVFNYRSGGEQLALQRAANQLAEDIRRTMEMALSGKERAGSFPQGGYGIYFNTSSASSYIIFADSNGNKNYDSGEEVEVVKIKEKNITIFSISSGSSLSITFLPPVPEINFLPSSETVNISLRNSQSQTKNIFINKVGLIEIQ
jgi:prepilin-type N-terminal cleavage/methylation domain-containing protein